jgi:HD superfamily phosphohydrolase YqeK
MIINISSLQSNQLNSTLSLQLALSITLPNMCPPSAFESSTITPSLEPEAFVPPTEISKAAFELASSLLHPAILNHSIRVYLYARAIAASQNSVYHTDLAKQDLLFTACILHDIGTTDTYNGPNRFEVDGADAAVAHLSKFYVNEGDKKEVWMAVALHTSIGIVQRMGDLCAIVRLAIEIDFGRKDGIQGIEVASLKARFEAKFEREDIEKVLSDAVVMQAAKNPDKAPSNSWPGGLYQSFLENPDWTGVNKAFGA